MYNLITIFISIICCDCDVFMQPTKNQSSNVFDA